MAKDALGHGSNGGWGAHPDAGTMKTAAKYQSLNGRRDAVVRTEPLSGQGGKDILWQHGSQYGYANNVGDAKATVESRVADEARYQTHGNISPNDPRVGSRDYDAFGRPRADKSSYDEATADMRLRGRNGQIGSGMKYRG